MNMDRRDAIRTMALGAVAAAASPWSARTVRAAAAETPGEGPHVLPDLPYAYDALEPHIDAQTMKIHHSKHHAAYVKKLNEALAGHPDLAALSVEELLKNIARVPREIMVAVRNHGGGHANHTLFWQCLSPSGGSEPSGELAEAVNTAFGSYTELRQQLTAAAKSVFGSGWAWLCAGAEKRLSVLTTANQDSPLMEGHIPLIGIDVWEHAYYLKHQNRRADYVEAVFNVLDWSVAGNRFAGIGA